ncbi:hypothetical protein BC332_02694 [Capsicum chinense]|nr:hypothetical protein BC332_02694 [Capsicum chinense]
MQLFLAFTEKVWGENNDEDAEKFAILYFLHSFVLSNIDTVVIPHLHFDLIALKDENWILRLLNWKTIAPRPRYEFLMNAMFKDNGKVVFKNIEPTEMEVAKLEIPKKDVTEDECSVDSDDDFQDPPSKKINERSKKKQKVRQEFKGVREEFTRVRQLVKKKFKKMVKAIEHSKQQHEDTKVEAQQMNYAGVETLPQQFSSIVDQNLDENQDGCTDLHPHKTNIQIDSQHLIPDELLQSINLDYKLSEKIVHHDDRITDEKLDDTNLSDSQFTISDELLPSLNAYRKESTTRHPLASSEEEQINEHFNDKKFEFVVQEHCQKNKENVGSSSKADMHGEVDVVLPDSQDTIPDDLLPTLNVYSSKSIIVHPSANREIQTPISRLRIRRPSKFKESPYTMKFGSAAESLKGHIRIFPQKHPFVYHPIDGIVDTKIVNKLGIGFLKTFSMFMLKAVLDVIEKLAAIIPLCLEHCDFYVKKGIYVENHPRYKDKDSSDMFDVLFQENFPQQLSRILKGKVDHYKRGKSKILWMQLGVETVKDKNWFYTMGFADQTWTYSHIDICFYYLRKKSKYGPHSLYKNEPNKSYKYSTVDCNFMNVIRSLNDVYSMDAQNLKDGGQENHLMEYINGFQRCIFLYDSYEFSGHYEVVLAEIEKIAKIIPLCLQTCDFYVKKGIDHQSHPRYKDKESSDMFDVLFQDDLPQQPSGSLDCGVFMVMYAECLSYGHKVIASEFDPNALRTRYAALLWDYGIRKQEANIISDVEAPVRPARQSRITSVTEVVDV